MEEITLIAILSWIFHMSDFLRLTLMSFKNFIKIIITITIIIIIIIIIIIMIIIIMITIIMIIIIVLLKYIF